MSEVKGINARLLQLIERHPEEEALIHEATNYIDELRGRQRLVTLALTPNEAQAILNALKESGVLDAPLIFDHVRTLVRKVSAGMSDAGYQPL